MNDVHLTPLEASKAFWRNELKAAPALLELPYDRPRPQEGSKESEQLAVELTEALSATLRSIATRHHSSPELVVGAMWSALLARLSGQDEVVLGLARSGPHRGGNPLLLPVRTSYAGNPEVAALIDAFAERVASAQVHSLWLPEIVGAIDRASAPYHPIFQAIAQLHRDAPPCNETGPAVDLDLALFDDGTRFTGRVRFSRDLLERATVERWFRHFVVLLEACDDPHLRFLDLPLLDDVARDQILTQWNRSERDLGGEGLLVHQLFEARARLEPGATALVDGDRVLSYAALNAQANVIAARLIALGVGPDDRVGVCSERSAGLVVALLGVLKSGAAYVPLDPSYPDDRLAYMVADSRPVAVLAQSALKAKVDAWLDPDRPTAVIVLEDACCDTTGLAADVGDPQVVGLTPRHLAYVIYTSGSTGKPKGVMNQHDAVVNSLLWAQSEFKLTRSDAWLQKTSYSFDVSVWEFFIPLLAGARLVIARPGGHREPDYLSMLIAREQVTVVQFVPSMLQIFLDHADLEKCASLRLLICGGEALPHALQQRFHTLLPKVEFQTLYGPTEAAVYVSHWKCSPGDAFVPLGRPFANTRIHVLDASMQPLPLGVIGELYIAGAQVARGYLNRPELSAERFVADPFVDQGSNARMYRTGDLARRRPDGSLEFLGRNDFQVKVHGHRIELGEIEARMQQFGGVREVAVLARSDNPGEPRLVGYFTAAPSADVVIADLRAHLAEALPPYMVPALFVRLLQFPSTANGKLDRNALPAPQVDRDDLSVAFEPAADESEARICAAFSQALGLDRVGRNDNFFELGGNSLGALRLLAGLENTTGQSLAAPIIFSNPTPASLAAALHNGGSEVIASNRVPVAHRSLATAEERLSGSARSAIHEPIAIIGMAGRFPGANTIEQFWRNLCEGRDSITTFSADELDPWVPASMRDSPNYVRARGILKDYDLFDAAFFGIPPREAELMDPQQRIFLELCWECMERAGHGPHTNTVPVGIFAGAWDSTYLHHHVMTHPDLVARVGELNVVAGNEKDYIATRVAHKLNLTGPAIGVYTACSTGLVAVCQAIDSLHLGHCDMALAGGISIACPPNTGYEYLEGAMFSPDGHTRTFDANGQGTVFNDGAAVVFLKRLSDALADGDMIQALILGSAVNNDGGEKASFTAPSVEGQAALIAMAQANAGVGARSITYVEAHGTGTPIGDPIEIAGLTKAFRRFTSERGFCRIGSVKSNVGHLISAAGSAGLIKTALALENRCIPATINFERNNPSIDFEGSPFVVNDRMTEWNADGGPLRAGVSSFGVGGTNAHVVLEQAPERVSSDPATGPQLLVLSARTPNALAAATEQLAARLDTAGTSNSADPLNLADVAWTLANGRKAFAYRTCVVGSDAADCVEQLRSPVLAASVRRSTPARRASPVFCFPGQGSQYPGMGRALHETEPAFAAAFDACIDAMPGGLGLDQRERMWSEDPAALLPTSVMQPAVFTVEYALAQYWISLGVTPSALIGHSVGEFVAATLAGVFSLPDAMLLVSRRGSLMQNQPGGSMLSVKLPLQRLLACLPDDLDLAAENSPTSCVVSGTVAAIESFRRHLEAEGIPCRRLETSHAFHSVMMDAVVQPFSKLVESVSRHAAAIPIMSTSRADWLDAGLARSSGYWSEHLRRPVRFSAALLRLLDTGPQLLLECGPRSTLTTLARQHAEQMSSREAFAVASLGDAKELELASVRAATGTLWCRGVELDLSRLDTRKRRHRVLLPTYPFERQRHWVDAIPAVPTAAAAKDSTRKESAEQAVTSLVSVGTPRRRPGKFASVFSSLMGLLSADASERSGRSGDAPTGINPEPGLPAQAAPIAAVVTTMPVLGQTAALDVGSATGLDASEQLIAHLFEELCGCTDVTRDDNFFQLGGDSLAAVQFLRRFEHETGVRLNMLLLAKGTVGSLARQIPGGSIAGAAAPSGLPSPRPRQDGAAAA